MAANESFVGRHDGAGGVGDTGLRNLGLGPAGFKALNSELGMAKKIMAEGLLAGVAELATGGSKVKAVWESIKWGTLARVGMAGFAGLLLGAQALAGGIRKAVEESGALQAAINRLAATKILTRQFEVFMGGIAAARARVAELYSFVATSRFNFTEVANASRVLTIFTNGAAGGQRSLQMLGRIATATNTPLEELAEIYARLNQTARAGGDISGGISQLRELGVISESTAGRLIALQRGGASPSIVGHAISEAFEQASDSMGDTETSLEDLEGRAAKAKEALIAAFATDFVEAHRKQVELTGKVYENLTPAMASVGKLLAAMTAPFENVKVRVKEIAGTSAFGTTIKELSEIAVILPVVAAGYGVLKGAIALVKTTGTVFQRGAARAIAELPKVEVPKPEAPKVEVPPTKAEVAKPGTVEVPPVEVPAAKAEVAKPETVEAETVKAPEVKVIPPAPQTVEQIVKTEAKVISPLPVDAPKVDVIPPEPETVKQVVKTEAQPIAPEPIEAPKAEVIPPESESAKQVVRTEPQIVKPEPIVVPQAKVVPPKPQTVTQVVKVQTKVETKPGEFAAGLRGGLGEVFKTAQAAVSPAAASELLTSRAEDQIKKVKELREKAAGLQQIVAGPLGQRLAPKQIESVLGEAAGLTRSAAGMEMLSKGSKGLSTVFGGLSKVLGLVRGGFVTLAASLVEFAIPIAIITGVTAVLTKAWDTYQDHLARIEHVNALTKGMAASNAEMIKAIANLHTMDDAYLLAANARQKLNDAIAEEEKVKGDTGATLKEQVTAAANVANARRNVHRADAAANAENLAMGSREMARLQQRMVLEKEIRDIVFQARFARATGAEQALMLAQRELDMRKKVAEYAAAESTETPIARARDEVEQATKANEDLKKSIQERVKAAEKEVEEYPRKEALARAQGLPIPPREVPEAKLATARKELETAETEGGPELKAAREKLQKLLSGGSVADQMEAQANELEKLVGTKVARPTLPKEIEALRVGATERRVVGKEEAAKAAAEAHEQLVTMQKEGYMRKIGLEEQTRMLAIRRDSAGYEEEISRIKEEELTREFNMRNIQLKAEAEEQRKLGTPEGLLAARTIEEQMGNLATEYQNSVTAEREARELRTRQARRELDAVQAGIDIRQEQNRALVAVAKGNFADAAAAMASARKKEDEQAMIARRLELAAMPGVKPEEIEPQVQREQRAREADRRARAEATEITERRRIREMQLEAAKKGIQPVTIPGVAQERLPTGAAARKELISMRDFDTFRDNFEKLIATMGEEPGGGARAAELAKQATLAEIQSQAVAPGLGAVADSLTKIGGGGGFYAGVSGDPQLQQQTRTNEILTQIHQFITEEAKIDVPVGN